MQLGMWNGTAILLTSFGSADDSIRAKTFDKLATEISAAFPTFEVRRAFTSNFIIGKLSRRGIFIDTPAETIARLRGDGFQKIFLLPTHLTAGEEFDNKIKICAAADVEIIPPLFGDDSSTLFDKKILATVIDCFKPAADEDLILVGHGSPHRHNPVYENLQQLAGDRIHIGVVEETDTPTFADVVERLRIRRAEKILLAPLLFNGGVHVAVEIAGEKNSWLSRLTALGYVVRVIRNGLGTFENFRALYINKLRERIELFEGCNFGRRLRHAHKRGIATYPKADD